MKQEEAKKAAERRKDSTPRHKRVREADEVVGDKPSEGNKAIEMGGKGRRKKEEEQK